MAVEEVERHRRLAEQRLQLLRRRLQRRRRRRRRVAVGGRRRIRGSGLGRGYGGISIGLVGGSLSFFASFVVLRNHTPDLVATLEVAEGALDDLHIAPVPLRRIRRGR